MDLKEIDVNTWNRVQSAQNRNYWRALVNAALNLQVSKHMELLIIITAFWLFSISVLSRFILYFNPWEEANGSILHGVNSMTNTRESV